MAIVTRTLYSVAEANEVLPLARSIVRDIVDEFRTLRTVGRERRTLEVQAGTDGAHAERLAELGGEVARQSERIESYLQELASLGLEVRDLELGLVDFPTIVEGEPAYLSWRLGEEQVTFWHPADRGFTDRVPLPAAPVGARR